MKRITTIALVCLCVTATQAQKIKELSEKEKQQYSKQDSVTVMTTVGPLKLPPPYATESVTFRHLMADWPENQLPKVPAGFKVERLTSDLKNPRTSYIAPNGDIFVTESNTFNSADRITILRDADKNGSYEVREVFAENLKLPFGTLIIKDQFYVALSDGLYVYPYKKGNLKLQGKGRKIVELPAGGYNNHWTRNIIANKDQTKIYISVGSASNVGEYGLEKEVRRAAILEVNLDGAGEIIYGSGLRNPVGMDWNPVDGSLWTAVNERDNLGDGLVPDYVTHVQKSGFYGWPYSYFGNIEDPRLKGMRPDLVKQALVPDVAVGNHTASLGLTFYAGSKFPEKYRNGIFVAQHGSWNKSSFSGYKVVFIPFKDGKPSGKPEDFMTGFIADHEKAKVYGRPSAVKNLPDGSLLVNDDSGNVLWRISYTGN